MRIVIRAQTLDEFIPLTPPEKPEPRPFSRFRMFASAMLERGWHRETKFHYVVAYSKGNATVWVSHPDNQFRSIYFLTQKLVLVVPRASMVDTMRDAYARIQMAEHGFGAFISGSSRTADIEQSLVMGAHGAMAALVVFI